MIQIAITAGGTEEPIDGIRKITNMSLVHWDGIA